MAWKFVECAHVVKNRKNFMKSWPAEMQAIGTNFRTLIQALEIGTQLEQLKLLGFVHGNYPLGFLSIDETGHGLKTKPKAIRLYLYPCFEEEVLYAMRLGNKQSQPNDVAVCKEMVEAKIASLQSDPGKAT